MPVNDLEQIIKECQHNKRKAQQQLYNRYAGSMLGVCMRYCKNRMEAEDCLQESFIKIYSKIHLFGFKGSFDGWVRRIVVNTVIEHIRKKKPEFLTDKFPVLKEEEGEVNVTLINKDELLKIIQELPPRYRLVFNMYAIERYSHKEIAEELNISVGTSKSNLSRARQWLQQKIKERLKDKKQVV